MASRATKTALLSVLTHSDNNFDRSFEKLCRRRDDDDQGVEKTVRKIIERVREGGDAEVLALTKKHDGAALKKEAEEAVKELMGDDETVHGGGARITWRSSTRSKFVAKRFHAAHPDIDLTSFYDVTESRSFRPTFD